MNAAYLLLTIASGIGESWHYGAAYPLLALLAAFLALKFLFD